MAEPDKSPGPQNWLYLNSGTLMLSLLIFLSNFVFDDIQNKDSQLQEEVKKLNIAMAELKASVLPMITTFNLANQKRYTSDDALRDQGRWQQQLEEVKTQLREQQSESRELDDRLVKVELRF
jgi:hypothetical protein